MSTSDDLRRFVANVEDPSRNQVPSVFLYEGPGATLTLGSPVLESVAR